MTEVLLLSDIHAANRPPSSCTESYMDDLMDLLQQAKALVMLRECAAMVWAGDIFHHKAPSRTPHELVQKFIDYIQGMPVPVFIVPGNHDMLNEKIESVTVTQPLGVLLKAGAHLLDGLAQPSARRLRWGSFKLYGVPWLQGYGDYGAYDGDEPLSPIEMNLARALKKWRESSIGADEPYLVVTHAPLYPPGKELKYEYFPAERWAEAMGGHGQVFYGHVHESHGAYRAGGVTFCNNGALSRGSLHEYNLTREVGVTLWDDQTGKFEFVPLAAKPASEVFRLKEKQQATDMQGRLDDFLSGISSASLEVMSAESVVEHVRAMGIGKDAEDLIEELLAEAGHGQAG